METKPRQAQSRFKSKLNQFCVGALGASAAFLTLRGLGLQVDEIVALAALFGIFTPLVIILLRR